MTKTEDAREPEGGAVWPEVTDAWADTYCALTGRDPDGQQVAFVDGGVATTFRNVAKREIEAMLCAAPKSAVAALATREEAPADHVSDARQMVEAPAFLSWLESEIDEASLDIGATYQEGGAPTLAEKQRASTLSYVREQYIVLRAQPPAREDVQPVARVVSAHGDPEAFGEREIKVLQDLSNIPYNTPLYTHPAPDALRVALEALEKIADARVFDERGEDYRGIAHPYRACRADETEQVAIKALAALQQEKNTK